MKSAQQEEFQARLHPRTIDAVWAAHRNDCQRCAQYVEGDTKSLAYVCPEGVQYLNAWLKKHEPKRKSVRPARPENWVSKEELKRITRYKE